ncbi:MAG: IS256 family transposase [bacterium]|nr:IS256 family transposase [bacterium]
MNKRKAQLIDELLEDCKTQEDVFGKNGLIKQLVKGVVERALDAELSDHLGYSKNSPEGNNSGNSRNGHSKKSVISDHGTIPLEVPRDRQSTFEPQMVAKGQRRIDGFDDKILALYSRGMSTRDIQAHLFEIYSTEVSPELISRVTDAVEDELIEWRNRPLEEVYPIVFLDALMIKVRENNRVVKKAVYLIIGINQEGVRDILGFWLQTGEGASYWMHIMTELQNRGVEDILIACIDGLKGLPEAIEAVFPLTQVQLCVVHMIRNSTKYVSYKDRKPLCADLKNVYGAANEESALKALDTFAKQWTKYPQIAPIWQRNWHYVSPFLEYPKPIRKVIYTTNAIESLNRCIRKVIKNKASFPTDKAAEKIIYLALKNKKLRGWKNPVCYWPEASNQLSIIFEDRFRNENSNQKSFTQKN